jgi:cytochrome c oxidase subunit II
MRVFEIVAAILVLAALAGLPATVFGSDSARHSTNHEQVITLEGKDGTWSQDTIRVEQGQKIQLHLKSNDVVHGFMLKGYGIDIDEVYPGKEMVINFVADEAGTFPFACTVPCSPNHRNMRGNLIVEP